jgi:hypothetical protein
VNLAVMVGEKLDQEIEACRLYHRGVRKTAASFAWASLAQAQHWRDMSRALVMPQYKMQCREEMRAAARRFRRWAARV